MLEHSASATAASMASRLPQYRMMYETFVLEASAMARLVTSSTGCVAKRSIVAPIMRCSLRSWVGRFFPRGATWVNAMAMTVTIPRF